MSDRIDAGGTEAHASDDGTVATGIAEHPGRGRHAGRLLMGRYALVELLGEGGMGEVYRGYHVNLHRPVAVKILREQFARKPAFVGRFLREARAAARIDHRNVVEVIDFGEERDGTVFCVMELLPGETLAETLAREGKLSWPRARGVMLQICDALQAAHDAGVVHRDVKPANCLRSSVVESSEKNPEDAGDLVKVIDFGIAKMSCLDGAPLPGGHTAQGTVMGTADYIAPEQARGSETDHRADVYGAGVLLYELLTGQVPFSAATSLDLIAQHLYLPPTPPSRVAPLASIPIEVDGVVLRALSKDPESRFQTVAQMKAALQAIEADRLAVPRRGGGRRRWGLIAVWATTLATGVAVSFVWPLIGTYAFPTGDSARSGSAPGEAIREQPEVRVESPGPGKPELPSETEASASRGDVVVSRGEQGTSEPEVERSSASVSRRRARPAPPPPAQVMATSALTTPTTHRARRRREAPTSPRGGTGSTDPRAEAEGEAPVDGEDGTEAREDPEGAPGNGDEKREEPTPSGSARQGPGRD